LNLNSIFSNLNILEMLQLILLFYSTKATSEGGLDNNGTYVWNKLDADVADSYSPPVLENSDVPDLQRNRVRIEESDLNIYTRGLC